MEAVAEAVIADARRRRRSRRLMLAGVAALALAGSLGGYMLSKQGGGGPAIPASARSPAPKSTPSLPASVATGNEIVIAVAESGDATTPPFSEMPTIMQRPRLASDAVPSVDRLARRSSESPRFRRSFGRLLYSESRAVAADGETLFLVPTTQRGICVLGGADTFGCMRGFDRPGIAWEGHNVGNTSMAFVGIASAAVSEVDLVTGAGRVRAHLRAGFFWAEAPVNLAAASPLNSHPSLNVKFVVRYRDGTRPATDTLRLP